MRDFCSNRRISFIVKARAAPIRYASISQSSYLDPLRILDIDKNAGEMKMQHC
jgi:hypothetical protein